MKIPKKMNFKFLSGIPKLVGRARRWAFLNVWCRHLYRPTLRLTFRVSAANEDKVQHFVRHLAEVRNENAN